MQVKDNKSCIDEFFTEANCSKKTTSRTYMDHRGKLDDLSNNREVMMNSKGCRNGDRIGVICHGNRDGVEKNRDQDSTASTREDHGDKLV